MVKGYDRLNLACGTFVQKGIVLQHGMISHLQGVSNSIVFMNQRAKNVRMFIILFNLSFTNELVRTMIKKVYRSTRGAFVFRLRKKPCVF